MKKKYFFMSGLPRSGNTLISCILNQNPEIKVSANSVVPDILYTLEKLKFNDVFLNFPDHNSLENLLKNVFDLYYKDWDCSYIIDRGPWGTPDNLYLLKKYLGDDIKIISPVRNVMEVLVSMKNKREKTLSFNIESMLKDGIRFPCDKSLEEIKYELLMQTNSSVEKGLFGVKNLLEKENIKYVKFIEYDNLVKDTKEVIKSIYEFLDISYYDRHDFNNLKQFEVNNICYDDSVFLDNSGLHHISSKITPSKTDVKNIDPKILSKYSNLEFWRN